jgi:cobyrinic acid a,c-diamide synthase
VNYIIPRVVIAGLKGGSGKTTLSLGLLASFRKKGKRIVSFKKGPDYIDPGWMAKAADSPCFNLDAFLFPEEKVVQSFVYRSKGADGALIEGNRGLFDGMDEKGTFSTARLAKSIHAPVVLIVDCTKSTTTIAAIIRGVLAFDDELHVGGVVLNQLAGERHERIIRKAIETYTDVMVIGALRRRKEEFMEERHLGLVPQQESTGVDDTLDRLADFVAGSVNVKDVLAIMESAPPVTVQSDIEPSIRFSSSGDAVRIGVLKDAAFQFYYPDNLEKLENAGAEIIEVNALKDGQLPDIDALYIGGGFPETQAGALSGNVSLLRSIKAGADNGLPVYAECGGLMYLAEQIEYKGETYKMAGVLPIVCVVGIRPAAHGYTIVEVVEKNPFFEKGKELKGHEFHYSRIVEMKRGSGMTLAFRMKRGEGFGEGYDGIMYKNVLATYTHLHALGSPEWIDGMMKAGRHSKKVRSGM